MTTVNPFAGAHLADATAQATSSIPTLKMPLQGTGSPLLGMLGHLLYGGQEIEHLPGNLISEALTGKPEVNFNDSLFGGGGSKKKTAAPAAPPIAGSATNYPSGSTISGLLSSLLGASQSQVPTGYADFFSQVLGPYQQHLAASMNQQLASSLGSPAAGVPGLSSADAKVVDQAYGNQLQNYQQINNAEQQMASPAAAAFQNYLAGPLAQSTKLMGTLQNALSFLPYSAAGIGTVPEYATQILQALGITGLPTTGVAGASTAPAGTNPAVAAGAAPQISQ